MDIDKYNQHLELLLDPDTVYHYTTAQVAMEHILKDKKLRLSPFTSTNDPMDYNYIFFGVTLWGERDDLENNALKAIVNLKKITRNNLCFVSFCRNRDITELKNSDRLNSNRLGCFRPRMWSQYGDGHKGVCIAFSLKELEKQLELQEIKNQGFYSGQIEYFDFPVISRKEISLKGNEIADIGAEKYAEDFIQKNWNKFLFRKHKDYRDEGEHRIIMRTTEPYNDFLFLDITNSIRAIILADNFNTTYYPIISTKSKELKIFARKFHWRNGEFLISKKCL